MKATKMTVTIKVEVLALDSVRGLLDEIPMNLREKPAGNIAHDDGDTIEWTTKMEAVEF